MSDLLVPISSVNAWQRIKVRQQGGGWMDAVVAAHDQGLRSGLMGKTYLVPQPGTTVICCQRFRPGGHPDTMFFQMPSTTLVKLDE